jgi:fatty acid desaturase (delta-4 desaturase)
MHRSHTTATVTASTCRSPYPNDSDLYNTIRQRVRDEIFKGTEIKGAHRSGSELAAAAVLGYAAAAYGLYCWDANLLTGALLGLAGAWIGLTVQHCGNHGAMSTKTWVNKTLGLCDDLIGGSSLMWRYHHQVRGQSCHSDHQGPLRQPLAAYSSSVYQ